ncbi:MAG: hypothetical protein R3208_15280 [Ketobacteraceae bacterium]|nr:hypothetical protein [Ketobacteraceae bacterium]
MKIFTPLIAMLLMMGAAYADVKGTWQVSNGHPVTVYYQDDDHVRMDVGNDTYLLIIREKAYTVMNQGGQKMVLDMESMGGAMKAFGGMAMQQAEAKANAYDPDSVAYGKTGKQETIAGYKGDLYEVSVKGPNGLEKYEFVASTHKDVVQLQKAFQIIGERMAKTLMSKDTLAGFNRAAEMAESQNIGGMLRYGNEMVLKSLERKDLPADIFLLPKDAVKMMLPSFGQ